MQRDEALAILAAHSDELRARGVTSLSLFGSVARNEAGPDSDVDILVEIGQRPFGLFEFVGLQLYLEELLGRPVDLVTPDTLKRQIRSRVLEEAVRAA